MTFRRTLVALLCCAAIWLSGQLSELIAQTAEPQKPAEAPAAAAPAAPAAPAAAPAALAPTIKLDKTALDNGGKVLVTGQAAPGKPVYLEVWAEDQVRSNFFDAKPDKDGKIPYKLFLTEQLPAHYKIYLPKDKKDGVEEYKKQGGGWPYSEAVNKLGAGFAYTVPAKVQIDAYQASIMASIIGSRGEPQPKLSDDENRRRSMQLTKARFRSPGKLFGTTVETKPDGSYTAEVTIPDGGAPGKYFIAATTGKGERSQPAVVENAIAFPMMYLENAGTSLNIFGPFLLTLAIGVFGVLMGAGGGFILNPLLLSIYPLPHTVVAGSVMPTVLFSQLSGVANYSKIKFISWKLGCAMGMAMLAGGFIGPKLTELITLDQYKSWFGYVLVVLALLMFWQTTPGYLEKNKKEQAILKEFKKRAEESAKA